MGKKITVIIVAGGTGTRMGTDIPKQFLELAGKPVIMHTLQKFEDSRDVKDIVVVCHSDHIEKMKEIIVRAGMNKILKIVPGGETRQASSYAGVKACPVDTEVVLIHDSVRPFINERIISDTISAAEKEGAAGVVIDIDDTVVSSEGDIVSDIPDRKTLKRVQTPQGFRYDTILRAHEEALEKGITDSTDDCGLVFNTGGAVRTVKGSAYNIKITGPSDLDLAENFISSGSFE